MVANGDNIMNIVSFPTIIKKMVANGDNIVNIVSFPTIIKHEQIETRLSLTKGSETIM